MSVSSITIKNLLSFDELKIKDINNISCFVGENNVGKSNLFKTLKFFYGQLEGKRQVGPELNSNYNVSGEIEVEYDLTRIRKIVIASRAKNNKFFKHMYKSMFNLEAEMLQGLFNHNEVKGKYDIGNFVKLKLIINKDGSSYWGNKDKEIRDIILYLFPFFDIDSRHIDLHNWDELWILLSKIKSFKIANVEPLTLGKKINDLISEGDEEFSKFIGILINSLNLKNYTHKEKLLSLIKASLPGDSFYSSGGMSYYQSDGTNSFNFINNALKLLITITRREYISPIILIDEPEVGLHPKKAETLINNLYDTFIKTEFNNNKKVNTPYPKIFVSTHSPNIVKELIRKFKSKQTIYHVSKKDKNTYMSTLNSLHQNLKYISRFSDNEARLVFSKFILFVEGITEKELFGNEELIKLFPKLSLIDVYPCSDNVLSEAINPGKSNASIPFLFVYDVDKAFEFTPVKKNKTLKVKFKNSSSLVEFKKEKLLESVKYYKKGYSKEHKYKILQINKLLTFDSFVFALTPCISQFKRDSAFKVMRSLVREYSYDRKVHILEDTIEGVLICQESKVLFYKWLFKYKSIDIFTLEKRLMGRKYLNDRVLFDYVRFIFNSKLDSQLNLNKSQKHMKILEKIKKTTGLKTASKTDGWVTSFLNFALMDLNSKSNNKNDLLNEFVIHFPALNAIIERVNVR